MRLSRKLSLLGAVLLVSMVPTHLRANRGTSKQVSRKADSSTANTPSSPRAKAPVKPAKKKVSARRSKKHRRERGQKAPTPDRIREIQSALAREGAYPGEPTGQWDAESIAAMERFQAANGLHATGKLDALSLQKLGLGSEVAGVAAPRPPSQRVPSTSTRP